MQNAEKYATYLYLWDDSMKWEIRIKFLFLEPIPDETGNKDKNLTTRS